MEMLTYFRSMSLKKNNVSVWFLVLPIDNIYIYIDTFASYFTDLPLYTVVYLKIRVGDNRGTVNTSTSPHIFDQLGAENAC